MPNTSVGLKVKAGSAREKASSKVIILLVEPGTFQSDRNDVVESLIRGGPRVLIVCMNSQPDYIASCLDPDIGIDNLHFLDVASREDMRRPRTTYLGFRTTLTELQIKIKEQLEEVKPEYFLFDSLDQLVNREGNREFVQILINTLYEDRANAILLVGKDKASNELVKDAQRHTADTMDYNKLKIKEAIEWTEYRPE